GAKIGQEVAGSPTIVTSSSRIERGAEGLYSTGRRQEPADVGAGGVARGSRRRHRKRADVLSHGARILKINLLWSDLNIEQRGLDIGMTHQLHKRGQADAGKQHVRGKCVSKP